MKNLMLTAATLGILAAAAAPVMAADQITTRNQEQQTAAAPYKSFKDMTPAEQAAKKAEWQQKRDQRWADTDTDKDGNLSKTEFLAENQKHATEMFDKIDANHDGKITKDEMSAARQMMHDHFKQRMDSGK